MIARHAERRWREIGLESRSEAPFAAGHTIKLSAVGIPASPLSRRAWSAPRHGLFTTGSTSRSFTFVPVVHGLGNAKKREKFYFVIDVGHGWLVLNDGLTSDLFGNEASATDFAIECARKETDCGAVLVQKEGRRAGRPNPGSPDRSSGPL